jgi:hypothetical protein
MEATCGSHMHRCLPTANASVPIEEGLVLALGISSELASTIECEFRRSNVPVSAAGRRERWAASILHRCLGLAVQRAEVHIADVAVTYFQVTAFPKPQPASMMLQLPS